jgi:hypothetical protein
MQEDPPEMHQISRKEQESGRNLSGGGISTVWQVER